MTATALTLVFWWELWNGAGIVGGDSQTYFLPQKTYLVDHLRRGVLPLWNNLVAHGYPVVGESQTALFYPTTLPIYSLLSPDRGFSVNILLHYVLTFCFAWLYARRLRLSFLGSCLVAMVYTYGWFPPRLSVEWAITTGAWFPLAFWCVESYFQTGQRRYLYLLSLSLAVQLLAGHFCLAFITQVFLMPYCGLRCSRWFSSPDAPATGWKSAMIVAAAIGFAYPLSAVQLLPTLEYRQASDRGGLPFPDVEYGRMPAWYVGQLAAPWHYYSSEVNLDSDGGPATNRLAAHLYVGLAPLGLALLSSCFRKVRENRLLWLWGLLGLIGLLFATGWLVPVTRHLPGFGYFKAPGLYGLVTTFALALLAGASFDRLWQSGFLKEKLLLLILVFPSAIYDLYLVSRIVTFTQFVTPAPDSYREESIIRADLLASPQPPRVLARGQNGVSSAGVAVFPGYLGMTPEVYQNPKTRLPPPVPYETPPTPEQLDWFRRAGVTHVLSLEQLNQESWPVGFRRWVQENYLNGLFLYRGQLYLYDLEGSRGRLSWEQPGPDKSAVLTRYQANEVTADVASPQGGLLILTDLDFPGWTVEIDGQRAESVLVEGMYRGVQVPPGDHRVQWSYRPQSLDWGATLSSASLGVLALLGFLQRKKQRPSPGVGQQ